ncbi:hypothetical protein [Parasphingorhabdus sp.]|uniref:hypothetical protein n=1 Tax=Parasphingorhabdus sp. TaxID=2709688 RepID=UPI003A8D2403
MSKPSQARSPKYSSRVTKKMCWLSGSSMAAAAFILASSVPPARAQTFSPDPNRAFQVNFTSASGTGSFVPTANLDIVTVTSSELLLNWQPLDTNAATFDPVSGLVNNPIDILPSGRTLRFQSAGTDYTVLNRILPSATADGRPIQFNGTVESLIGGAPGGNVWFYSPGGIIVGSTALFDVGSLVLTSNDIDTTGGLFGSEGEIRFRGVNNNSSVIIQSNNDATPQIRQATEGSYLAIVAPRIEQGGDVSVNGSVAYVAAEQADLTINNGLFDISIGVGTTDTNGVVHTGLTTGPSSTPTFNGSGDVTNADAQAIYMVSVPKNDAVTMLVGGSLGYQAAASATIINGSVVLSAGADVATTGDITNTGFAFDTDAPDSDSNIQLQNVTFGSSVSAFATNGIIASTSSATDFVVANNSQGTQDLSLAARDQIDINARGGGTIGANGNVTLRAGFGNTGGTININADQTGFTDTIVSGLIATGNLVVDTSATGLDDFFTVRNNGNTGIGEDAVGGDINININGGGDLVVGGTAQFIATAQGGKGENLNGSGQGGNIDLNMSSGTINVTGTTTFNSEVVSAQNGKVGGNGSGLIGSDSIAGDISVSLSGGSVTTGNMSFQLGAVASSGAAPGGAQSNDATAGAFDLTVTGGTHVIADLEIDAVADSRSGSFDTAGTEISGSAESGGANVLINGGSLTVNSNFDADLITYGVTPVSTDNSASLTVQNGGALTVGNLFYIQTLGLNGTDTIISGGGSVSLLADNAAITLGRIILDTSAKPNNHSSTFLSDEGRDFQAGDIRIVAQNGGTFTSGASGQSFFSANGTGNDSNAGNGTGGDLLFHANGGTINFTDDVSIDASGVGGVGGNSDNPDTLGVGRGGTLTLRVEGASGSMSFTDLDLDSDGSIANGGEGGAPPFEGDGGLGFGGDITFDLLGGTFIATDIIVGSDGLGGGGGDLVTPAASGLARSVAALALPADLSVAAAASVAPLSGGISAGDGGEGQGGDVTFNLNGGSAAVTNLTISANGFGGDGAKGYTDSGTAGGRGGRGLGGNATFNALAGNLTITSTLTVSASGNDQSLAPYPTTGGGGYGFGTDGGAGGSGIGGTATFNLDGSASINADNVVISTIAGGGHGGRSRSATDGLGNPVQAGIGGRGGDAVGGDATFNNNAGTLNFSQLTVNSTGTGGNGGDVFGPAGRADNIAGDGGSGTGGSATININQDDLNNPVYVVNASGIGGDGGDGLAGGDGGSAIGGIAAINIIDAVANPDDPSVIANATGGSGGAGKRDIVTGAPGDGGNGGSANAGTARLEVTGAGGSIDVGFITLEANASGGTGATGFYEFGSGIDGSDGGAGGTANGGAVEIIARTGATITISTGDFSMTSTGTGGAGGNGGNSYDSDSGDGGDGGDATGGTARLLAQGATISGDDLILTTAGQAGDGGNGGSYGIDGTNGISGTGGDGTGGTNIIEVQEGSPGIINFANVIMEANGSGGGGPIGGVGAGGRIEITDSSIDPAGLISLNSLTVDAFDTAVGAAAFSNSAPLGGFFVAGNSGAMSIVGDLTVNVAGNIEYSLDGDGQMTVGGNTILNSGQNILIAHSNNMSPVNSIDVAGTFAATAQGNFVSTAGSQVNAAGIATVRAEQNATVADIAGIGLVNISALQDVNVTNAAVSGVTTTVTLGAGTLVLGPQLTIAAGLNPTPTPTYNPNYDATIDGLVTSAGHIVVNAGGNATFANGSRTISDNGLTVQTGDDIVIATGASVIAAANPATTPNSTNPFTFNNLVLQAGALTPLSTTTLTPISSIVAAGDLDANSFAVVMTANAIDGLGGTISASSISVDIDDAPANGVVQRDDNSLLSAQCVEGNICLGALQADNLVYIGQASNNDVIQAFVESGTVTANEILVTTRRDIILGTTGIATSLNATNQLALQSTEGNINLADVSAISNAITINAAGSLLGSANLTSTNDIGITVGADVNAASITTDGQLTQVADVGGVPESLYTVPGSIAVGSYTQGTALRFRVEAGNDISFDEIIVPNREIQLLAAQTGPGDVFLGTTNGASDISLQGENVGFTSLDSTVSVISGITILATNGSITGGDALANFTTDLEAVGGDINIGDLTGGASGGTNLDATGSITVGAVSGGVVINVTAGDDFDFDTVEAFRTNINATNITGNIIQSLGVTGGGPNTLAMTASGDMTLGTATATDTLDLTVGGTLTANLLDGNFLVDITAAAVDVTTLNSAQIGNITATGGDLAIDDIVGESSIRLESQTGNVNLMTASTTSGFTVLANNGSINFADITARGIGLTAGGDITGTSLTATNAGANQNINLVSGGTATVTTMVANQIVDVDAASANFGDITGNALVRIEADDIITGDVASDGIVTLIASNGNIASGTLSGNSVQALATGGNVTTADVTGSSILARALDGNVSTGDLSATGGGASDVQVGASGTANFGSITAGRLVDIDGTVITGGDIDAVAFVDIDGTDISVGDVTAGDNLTINATTGSITTGALDAGLGITLSASENFDIASATNGNTTALRLSAINGSGHVGNVASQGSIVLTTGADLAAGVLDAATNITATAGGTPTIANALSGGNTSISGVSVTLNNGTIGGDLTLNATAGDVDGNGVVTSGGAIDLDATGNVGFGDLDAQGSTFTVDAGGNIEFTNAASSEDMNLNAGGGINGDNLTSGGDIMIDGTTIDFATASGGAIDIVSNGAVTFVAIDASGGVDIDTTAGTPVGDLTGGDIDASGPVSIISSRDVLLGNVSGGANVQIIGNNSIDVTVGSLNSSTNVSVRLQGAFVADEVNAAKTGQGSVNIRSDNGIGLNNISGNDIFLTAVNGLVKVTNNVDVTNSLSASGEAISIVTQQDMMVNAEATDGDIGLSSAGNLDVRGAQATGDITIAAGGSVSLNDANIITDSASISPVAAQIAITNGSNVIVTAVDDVLINSSVSAANDLQITAGSLIDIQASASGSNIQTESTDINIGADGDLRNPGNKGSIEFMNTGPGQMVVGNGTNDPTDAYKLDNDEFSRVFGGDLSFRTGIAAGTSESDLIIGELDVLSGNNIGDSGSLAFVSDGSIRVEGKLALGQATADNIVRLDAGDTIRLDASAGNIGLLDGNGVVAGQLELSARNIFALSDSARTDINGMTTEQIDIRLANNDGFIREEGFFQADMISMTLLASQLYVQNSGEGTDFDDRRGFVVGAGGLTIATGPSGVTPIVINGVISDANGNLTTGIPVVTAPTIAGAGFDPASTINGCVINNPASCTPTPTPTPTPTSNTPEIDDPVQDVIEEEVTPEIYTSDPFETNLITIKKNVDSVDNPMIDEPVTGAGNDDLWVSGVNCERDDSQKCMSTDKPEEFGPAE